MSEVNIGIIGLGGMSRYHLKRFGEVSGVHIAAICDVNAEAVREVGDQLRVPETKRYSSFEELINDDEIDGVVSVTPNNMHAAILKACIQAGKPLFAEKPLTRTYEEALEILELYQKKPIPCMINFSYRYGAGFQHAKKMISEGRLGRINHIFVQYLQGWGSPVYQTPFLWRFDDKITGTGTLGDLGSHMIDLAEYLIEDEITELQAMLSTIVPERPDPKTGVPTAVKVDDFACFHARFATGAMAVFQTSRNAIGSDNQHEISVYGDEGTLHVSTLNDREVVWIRPKAGERGVEKEIIEVPGEVGLNPWRAFAGLIRGNEAQGYATLEDGFRNQLILEAVVRSANDRKVVNVSSLQPEKAATQTAHRLEKEIRKKVTLNYLLHLPEGYEQDSAKKWPLILFLHGAGERGDQIDKVKKHGIPKIAQNKSDFPFIAVSPQCPENSSWIDEQDAVITLLDEIMEDYNVDSNRVYLTGLSMGGFGTWHLAAQYPGKFAAVAPICGGGNPSRVKALTKTPVWAFHGAQDFVVPLEQSAKMVKALQECGGRVKFTVYPEADHDSWTAAYNNPQLYTWFLSHSL